MRVYRRLESSHMVSKDPQEGKTKIFDYTVRSSCQIDKNEIVDGSNDVVQRATVETNHLKM